MINYIEIFTVVSNKNIFKIFYIDIEGKQDSGHLGFPIRMILALSYLKSP